MTREEAIKVLKKNRPSADPRRCGMELCTAVDMAIAALREQEHFRDLTKKMEWISVEERLPDGWEPVLVFRGQCKAVEIDFYRPVRYQWHNFADVTHWMPMPEPPEVEV